MLTPAPRFKLSFARGLNVPSLRGLNFPFLRRSPRSLIRTRLRSNCSQARQCSRPGEQPTGPTRVPKVGGYSPGMDLNPPPCTMMRTQMKARLPPSVAAFKAAQGAKASAGRPVAGAGFGRRSSIEACRAPIIFAEYFGDASEKMRNETTPAAAETRA